MEGRRGPALRPWRAAGGLVGRGHRQCSRRRAAGQSVRLAGVAAWPGRSALQRSQIMDPGSHPRSRSEEHTSELQSLMRISYAVFCLKKKKDYNNTVVIM